MTSDCSEQTIYGPRSMRFGCRGRREVWHVKCSDPVDQIKRACSRKWMLDRRPVSWSGYWLVGRGEQRVPAARSELNWEIGGDGQYLRSRKQW